MVSSFDSIDRSWMLRFLEHRIADPRLLRLIQKWMAAGVIENGEWSQTAEGTPQGSLCAAAHNDPYEQRRVMRSAGS